MTARWISILLVCVAVVGAAPAGAQPASDESRRTELFLQGKRLADEGRWSEAVVPLREVVAIRSAPKALLALAVVERQLMHFVEARALLERAEADAKAAALEDDAAAARKALDDLEKVIPRLVLTGDALDPRAAVFVDDRAPARRGAELLVDPGQHVVRIELPGREPHRERVSVAPGQTVQVQFTATAAAPPPTPASPAPQTEGPSLVGPLVLGGAGVALSGVGLALLLLGRSDQAEAENACGGTVDCSPALRDTVDGGATKIIAGDVLLGVGGAVALSGAIWLVVELTQDPTATTAIRPAPRGLEIVF